MAKKRYATKEIIGKLREAEVLIAQGRSVAEAARMIRVAPAAAIGNKKDACVMVLLSARSATPEQLPPQDRLNSARGIAQTAGMPIDSRQQLRTIQHILDDGSK